MSERPYSERPAAKPLLPTSELGTNPEPPQMNRKMGFVYLSLVAVIAIIGVVIFATVNRDEEYGAGSSSVTVGESTLERQCRESVAEKSGSDLATVKITAAEESPAGGLDLSGDYSNGGFACAADTNTSELHNVILFERTISAGESITDGCNASFQSGISLQDAAYEQENVAFDEVYADGIMTDEEQVGIDVALANTNQVIEAMTLESLNACVDAHDWMAAALNYPAFVGITDSYAVTDGSLQSACGRFADTPVCWSARDLGLQF